ncbi:MAG: spore cortex biosynthesis protein YabQ [Bacteroides sp.]|nr:spore cortex biosynthesis protein YabQ [Eubacterium sp.]MCM1417254.1 spore cortex biosynthesis protein YabQ [Roseburia sp.]MCM1461126.1 spore cortex biosynthesis protein YabQ [Bacteroides sp.]
MYDSTREILEQIGIFALIGVVLGVGYDLLRFFRILFRKGRLLIHLEDLFYLPFCAFLIFCCVVEYGGGKLRLYHLLAAGFGAAVYLITLGQLTRLIARAIRSFFDFLWKALKKPIYGCYRLIYQIFSSMFGALCQKIEKTVKIIRFYLKKASEMLYNKNNSKIGKSYETGGEERHVIQAEVRKKA